jgi:hypothetical protein
MKDLEILEIPTYADKSPRWDVKVDLSGRRYSLNVSYNMRQNAWMMNISDVNGDLLIAGIRLVPEVNFLEKYRASSPGLPPGDLVLIDREHNIRTAEVTRENLSSRFSLTYMVSKDE